MQPVIKQVLVAIKDVGIGLGVLLLLLVGCNQITRLRATPPKSVTDVASCLEWLDKPIGAYRITDGATVYYQVLGSAGRYLASGPSAYTFDSQGKFIGWTPDRGDVPTHGVHLSADAKRETISLDEMKRSLQ